MQFVSQEMLRRRKVFVVGGIDDKLAKSTCIQVPTTPYCSKSWHPRVSPAYVSALLSSNDQRPVRARILAAEGSQARRADAVPRGGSARRAHRNVHQQPRRQGAQPPAPRRGASRRVPAKVQPAAAPVYRSTPPVSCSLPQPSRTGRRPQGRQRQTASSSHPLPQLGEPSEGG